jgi:hypothetical protein
VFALGLAIVGCAGQHKLATPKTDALPPFGLYRVTSESCENPAQEPQGCEPIQYVEVTRSSVAHLARHPAVLIFWIAPDDAQSEYTYQTWPVYGRFVSSEMYLLHDEGAVRDWLIVRGGLLHEYDFEAFETDRRQKIRLRSRLSLQRIARTPEIDNRLQLLPD